MRRALSLVPFSIATLVLASVGLPACGGGEGAKDPTHAGSEANPAPSATSGQASLELSANSAVDRDALDTSVSPCDDFYQFACGSWLKKTEIPSDEATWSRSFSVIRDRNEEILHGILEGYAKGQGQDEPYAKQLGAYYGACMDEDGIEKAGTKPLAAKLAAIAAINDPNTLTRFLGKSVADGHGFVFDFGAAQDFDDANQVVGMVWQGGLGMPEREYYLDSSPKMSELRAKYQEHVASMLVLAGESKEQAKKSAETVLAIETELARAWMSKEDRRDPKKIKHRATKAELATVAPGIAWDTWLDGAGAKDVKSFNLGQPNFLVAVGQLLGTGKAAPKGEGDKRAAIPVADWKTYLRWHTYRANADLLPKRFVDEKFQWRKTLVGAQSLPPRWKRCVRATDAAMGEALAQPFVKKTLGEGGKATVVNMVRGIEAAMHGNLEGLAWMDDATRQAAFTKLARIANKIAYPDKWRSYEGLTVKADDFLGNTRRAENFEYKRQLAKIGKPVDRDEWQMSPPTVNAYYDPQLNEMVFPAGILQPPFYANAAPAPANFGGVGMVMGHELTHGFDDEGRRFDAEGNLKDWWSQKVDAEFEKRAACVKDQYDGYVVLGDLHVNGLLTLGENIADLGGVKLAHEAMRKALKDASASADQEFYLSFAQGWCTKLRDEALRFQVSTNPHSPPQFRVNGPLSNSPGFAKAFACGADSKMVRKDRCEIW